MKFAVKRVSHLRGVKLANCSSKHRKRVTHAMQRTHHATASSCVPLRTAQPHGLAVERVAAERGAFERGAVERVAVERVAASSVVPSSAKPSSVVPSSA